MRSKTICEPVVLTGRTIAKTWWGVRWNENLERYADYSNRIARGRSYVRSGAVIDLKVADGHILSRVQGSRRTPYKVEIAIAPLPESRAKRLTDECSKNIKSLEALAGGEFPQALAELLFSQREGLFPTPREIHFSCSCPDMASMCKHVAAVLYGVGSRLDSQPLLFFNLRGIDASAFIRRSAEQTLASMLRNAGSVSDRIIGDEAISELFGVL